MSGQRVEWSGDKVRKVQRKMTENVNGVVVKEERVGVRMLGIV